MNKLNFLRAMMSSAAFVLGATTTQAQTPDWSGFYPARTLTEWGNRVVPGIRAEFQETVLASVTGADRSAIQGVTLEFPQESPESLLHFYATKRRQIVLPVSSLRFFRDLCVAYVWLSRHGYDTQTVSDYLAMVRVVGKDPSFRQGRHLPLDVLGIPEDAMEDPQVELHARALFTSGVVMLLGHELGHIRFGHEGYANISRETARRQEMQCDQFSLRLMARSALTPAGALIFLIAATHLEMDQLGSDESKQNRTHPVGAERIRAIAKVIQENETAFVRGAQNRAVALASLTNLIAQIETIAVGIESPGVQAIMRLRGFAARTDRLLPRKPGQSDLGDLRVTSSPTLPFHGIYAGQWSSGPNQGLPASVIFVRQGKWIQGVVAFGTGHAGIQNAVLAENTLTFEWTLDAKNFGRGVFTFSPEGLLLRGTLGTGNKSAGTAEFDLRWLGEFTGQLNDYLPAWARAPIRSIRV